MIPRSRVLGEIIWEDGNFSSPIVVKQKQTIDQTIDALIEKGTGLRKNCEGTLLFYPTEKRYHKAIHFCSIYGRILYRTKS